jgi:hypothetical protein
MSNVREYNINGPDKIVTATGPLVRYEEMIRIRNAKVNAGIPLTYWKSDKYKLKVSPGKFLFASEN